MGILASIVDFSFSCCGFFDVAEAGFRRAESAVELMEARFSDGSGLSRVLRPDVLVAMHVGDESLVLVVQSPQKVRLLAIPAVDAHPRKPNSPGARPAHDVEREFALRHFLARGLGNPRPLAARRSSAPANRAAHRS